MFFNNYRLTWHCSSRAKTYLQFSLAAFIQTHHPFWQLPKTADRCRRRRVVFYKNIKIDFPGFVSEYFPLPIIFILLLKYRVPFSCSEKMKAYSWAFDMRYRCWYSLRGNYFLIVILNRYNLIIQTSRREQLRFLPALLWIIILLLLLIGGTGAASEGGTVGSKIFFDCLPVYVSYFITNYWRRFGNGIVFITVWLGNER